MERGVYLVTQGSRSGDHTTVEAANDGGVDIVQVRQKDVPARERHDIGRQVRTLTREAGVPLIVNDRADLARAVDTDNDGAVAAGRRAEE